MYHKEIHGTSRIAKGGVSKHMLPQPLKRLRRTLALENPTSVAIPSRSHQGGNRPARDSWARGPQLWRGAHGLFEHEVKELLRRLINQSRVVNRRIVKTTRGKARLAAEASSH
jgi:hypothetical protein